MATPSFSTTDLPGQALWFDLLAAAIVIAVALQAQHNINWLLVIAAVVAARLLIHDLWPPDTTSAAAVATRAIFAVAMIVAHVLAFDDDFTSMLLVVLPIVVILMLFQDVLFGEFGTSFAASYVVWQVLNLAYIAVSILAVVNKQTPSPGWLELPIVLLHSAAVVGAFYAIITRLALVLDR